MFPKTGKPHPNKILSQFSSCIVPRIEYNIPRVVTPLLCHFVTCHLSGDHISIKLKSNLLFTISYRSLSALLLPTFSLPSNFRLMFYEHQSGQRHNTNKLRDIRNQNRLTENSFPAISNKDLGNSSE